MENLIAGGKLLDFGLVLVRSGLAGLPFCRSGILGSLLLLIGGILGLAGLEDFRVSRSYLSLRLHRGILGLKYLAHQRVLKVYSNVVRRREGAVEIHSSAHRAHLAVAAHELILGNENRVGIHTEIVTIHNILILCREGSLEERA